MLTKAFNKVRELKDFVNESSIDKENIVSTFQNSEGLYVLIYYGEGE